MPASKTTLLKASHERYQKYLAWLKRQPLADQTRRAYRSRINHFLGYLGESGEDLRKLVKSDRELAHVLRTYKRHLKQNLKSRPNTVNAYLTAIDHFVGFLGGTPADVPREEPPQEAPRALDKKEQQRFLRAVAGCRRSKDRAVALLLYYTGIRIGECAGLDVDDVYVAGRKNQVVIRNGKGDRYREIPLNTEARNAVRDWLKVRTEKFDGRKTDEALFVNPQGRRMTTAGLDVIVRKIGESCGLSLSAHVLRHTCLTNLVRNGNDLVLVAEIGGHLRLETTRRYTLPTSQDREKAMERLVEST